MRSSDITPIARLRSLSEDEARAVFVKRLRGEDRSHIFGDPTMERPEDIVGEVLRRAPTWMPEAVRSAATQALFSVLREFESVLDRITSTKRESDGVEMGIRALRAYDWAGIESAEFRSIVERLVSAAELVAKRDPTVAARIDPYLAAACVRAKRDWTDRYFWMGKLDARNYDLYAFRFLAIGNRKNVFDSGGEYLLILGKLEEFLLRALDGFFKGGRAVNPVALLSDLIGDTDPVRWFGWMRSRISAKEEKVLLAAIAATEVGQGWLARLREAKEAEARTSGKRTLMKVSWDLMEATKAKASRHKYLKWRTKYGIGRQTAGPLSNDSQIKIKHLGEIFVALRTAPDRTYTRKGTIAMYQAHEDAIEA